MYQHLLGFHRHDLGGREFQVPQGILSEKDIASIVGTMWDEGSIGDQAYFFPREGCPPFPNGAIVSPTAPARGAGAPSPRRARTRTCDPQLRPARVRTRTRGVRGPARVRHGRNYKLKLLKVGEKNPKKKLNNY
jgi:hypothetical protein